MTPQLRCTTLRIMIDESGLWASAPGPSPLFGVAAAGDHRQRLALVVDDEASVGVLVARMLDELGWRAIVTTAPEDAVALASEVEVDLLVTDFEMPGMSGTDLAATIRRQRAGLPVVLVSGWPEAAAMRLDPPFAFTPKPFHIGSIRDALERLEQGARGTAEPGSAHAG
jgi:DNA-binding NtrC family response regulator